ncbi:hypothetical protein SAMN06296241_0366 [Salinimicrobium sediminis]|uniref:Uncharacterized protein n=1 Tax=Salinimicrobium sediminis TaxID=1343891 RepID=A0A285X396_9FLAO|nr:hypothetical protein [Salinimicrobium sediminis]SOC78849.1 hypothetical protein SAMN06296241_0366 [Salinimicrobium sediminis]
MVYRPPHIVFDRLHIMAQIIASEIEIKISSKADNLRLNYALRKKEQDKDQFTSEKLKKVRKQLGKYEGDIALYLREMVIDKNNSLDDIEEDERIERLCYNFLDSLFWPEDLIKLDPKLLENEDYTWDSRIEGNQDKINKIEVFIEAMALAGLYVDLQSLEGVGVHEEDKRIDFKPLPSNQSLLFNGKKLNLTERILIANKVLDFETKIRTLNISDTEKYQLMSYVLGNDVSNVRNVINGTRPNKVRENEINSYLKDLMK